MGIFAQDIEQATEQSFIAPGSRFYEYWISKFRNPYAWKCTYKNGTLSINLLLTDINQVAVSPGLPIIKTNDFFKDYLPGLQMIDCPEAFMAIRTLGDIDCHNVTIRAYQLSLQTPHTIQNVKFVASQNTSALMLAHATKIINFHMIGGELSLEYDITSADHPWGLYLPEFIDSSIDNSTSISIIAPERQKIYDELWMWIDWKALGLKCQPSQSQPANLDLIDRYNISKWNAVPVYDDVDISELLPLPELLLDKRQYFLINGMLTHNVIIAKLDALGDFSKINKLGTLTTQDNYLTKDGYIILI